MPADSSVSITPKASSSETTGLAGESETPPLGGWTGPALAVWLGAGPTEKANLRYLTEAQEKAPVIGKGGFEPGKEGVTRRAGPRIGNMARIRR